MLHLLYMGAVGEQTAEVQIRTAKFLTARVKGYTQMSNGED